MPVVGRRVERRSDRLTATTQRPRDKVRRWVRESLRGGNSKLPCPHRRERPPPGSHLAVRYHSVGGAAMTDPYASVKAHFEKVAGVTVNAGRGAQGLKVGKKMFAMFSKGRPTPQTAAGAGRGTDRRRARSVLRSWNRQGDEELCVDPGGQETLLDQAVRRSGGSGWLSSRTVPQSPSNNHIQTDGASRRS